jgi:hypothetical protein
MMPTRSRRVPRPFAFFAGLLAAALIVPTIAFAANPASPSAAIGNALGNDMLRQAFATPQVQRVLQPVISIEHFNASPGDSATQLLSP